MFVLNIDDVKGIKTFKYGKLLANWLIQRNIPLLALSKDGKYVFADTELLRELLENKPFILDILDFL